MVAEPGMRSSVSSLAGRFDVRAHRTFLDASLWNWWRQPHPLAVALASADRTDQSEGVAVSRIGSSRFDNVASFASSFTGTWQDNFILQNSEHALEVHFYRLFSQFHVGWAHGCKWGVAQRNLLLYPLIGLYKICTRSVLERLGRQ